MSDETFRRGARYALMLVDTWAAGASGSRAVTQAQGAREAAAAILAQVDDLRDPDPRADAPEVASGAGMTIAGLDDAHRFLAYHLADRVFTRSDAENLQACLRVIARDAVLLSRIRNLLSEG